MTTLVAMADVYEPDPTYVHRNCRTCGRSFGLRNEEVFDEFGPDCLATDCDSYDIDRDPTFMFAPDEPELIE